MYQEDSLKLHSKRTHQVEPEPVSPAPAPSPAFLQDTWTDPSGDAVGADSAPSYHSENILEHPLPEEATSEAGGHNLPVEPAHQSPDPEDSHMQDGPHPLSLLSDIGSRLRSYENERAQDPFQNASELDELSSDIGPGWTSAQLRIASARKRFYFRHRLSSTKRDTLPSLDPISKGLLTEDVAEELIRG